MSGFPFKTALFAIALSPFILNAELRDDVDDSYDDDYVSYTDDRDDENEDGLYYDDDAMDDDLADASYSRRDAYSEDDGDEDSGCHSPFHRMHVGVRHTEPRGVGFHDGYTTLEGFGIYDHNSSFMPFLDLRGHVFNNGKLAGNVGIGERSVISSINHMVGVYLYYDVRQENHNFTINQLSPGIELLGKRMEYRMNGYFPVGGHRSHKYGFEFNRFSGNNILLRQKQKFAMKGGDAEVGAHITQSTKYDLYAGAGPYYFSAGRSNGWGGKVRLLGRYKEYVSLEASYTYDRMFRSIVQGTIGFNYAFGKKLSRRDRNCPQKNDLMLSRAAFAPYRFEIPAVKKIRKNVRAINPATGRPWQVWFVDNTSSSAGTYQSPFPTLAQAQAASSANDMIYVFPGDGTTKGMNAGITLQDRQKLFGSSVTHKIKTTRGKMVIPTFSETAPTITNTANIVTLANGNEVSGMNISASTIGITAINTPSSVNGVKINHNIISGNVDYQGINVQGTGKIVITHNQLTSPIGSGHIGINYIVGNSGTIKANISHNAISGFEDGIICSVQPPNTSSIIALISNNAISNFNGIGILAGMGTHNTLIQVTNNAILANAADTFAGIAVSADSHDTDSGTCVVNNNAIAVTASNTLVSGIFIQDVDINGSVRVIVDNNAILTGAGSGSAGILMTTISGVICSDITRNIISLQAPTGTNGMNISGNVNIEDFSRNIAPAITITGTNVNLVAPGTCSQ